MHSALLGLQQQLPCGKQCMHHAVTFRHRQFAFNRFQNDTRTYQLRTRATLTKPNKQSAQHPPVHHSPGRASAETVSDRQSPATFESLQLHSHNPDNTAKLDLVVAGAGPSGIAVAERVSAAGYKVCVVDPAPLAHWPNNYGVWVDEFEAMGLQDCLEIIWPKAKVHLDSGKENERYLYRPYGRVDRTKLKSKLLQRCVQHGVTFHETKAAKVEHAEGSSTLTCSDGSQLHSALVLDCTGHARKLVTFDEKFDPGYQAAYGMMIEVESHPFELDTMLFMDWRDDHTQGRPEMRAANQKLPTFLYVMPFSKTKLFLEETSLVSRPPFAFQELKDRLQVRMEHLGIKVKSMTEEEYCLIPMGGVLPTFPQRTLGIGGTGGMVHPSTGYMVARVLGAAPVLADAIIDQLAAPSDRATDAGAPNGASNEQEAVDMTSKVWKAIWPKERLRQREFFTFGMDVLLKLDLRETRQFFSAFFGLSDFHWQGFLSSRLSFPQLMAFGLALFANSSNQARANLIFKGTPGLFSMFTGLGKTYLPDKKSK